MTKRFLIIAALALLVRVWAVFTERLPLSGDEMAHGNYVAYIHEHWSLPDSAVANEFLPAGQEGLVRMSYEFYQPPGYYILAAVFGGGTPLGSRLVSVAMFMVAFFFVWAATRKPGSAGDLSLLCALAFIPGIIVTTSIIGNDVFLLLGSAILLYACVKRKTWAFILGGAVLATAKFHGIPILAVIAGYYFFKRQRKWSLIAAAFTVVGILITIWRWELQDVNRASIVLFEPAIIKSVHVVATTLATGIIHPVADSLGQAASMLGITIGVLLLILAGRRIRKGLPLLHLLVMGAVVLVWAVFSFTHMWWHGRLLYAALPWLVMVREKSTGTEQPAKTPAKSRRKPARNKRGTGPHLCCAFVPSCVKSGGVVGGHVDRSANQ